MLGMEFGRAVLEQMKEQKKTEGWEAGILARASGTGIAWLPAGARLRVERG